MVRSGVGGTSSGAPHVTTERGGGGGRPRGGAALLRMGMRVRTPCSELDTNAPTAAAAPRPKLGRPTRHVVTYTSFGQQQGQVQAQAHHNNHHPQQQQQQQQQQGGAPAPAATVAEKPRPPRQQRSAASTHPPDPAAEAQAAAGVPAADASAPDDAGAPAVLPLPADAKLAPAKRPQRAEPDGAPKRPCTQTRTSTPAAARAAAPAFAEWGGGPGAGAVEERYASLERAQQDALVRALELEQEQRAEGERTAKIEAHAARCAERLAEQERRYAELSDFLDTERAVMLEALRTAPAPGALDNALLEIETLRQECTAADAVVQALERERDAEREKAAAYRAEAEGRLEGLLEDLKLAEEDAVDLEGVIAAARRQLDDGDVQTAAKILSGRLLL